MVERFFAEITERQIRRGVHTSVKQLEEAIDTTIARRNDAPKPFTWVRTADEILGATRRFCLRICSDNSEAYLWFGALVVWSKLTDPGPFREPDHQINGVVVR